MRKVLTDNRLRVSCSLRSGRRAFSLAELVVSMALLVLMMSLAGQVFNFTVQSTGQATALTRLSQRLRAFEERLREDLRHVQPGNSVLLIQGNPVNAHWTQDDREADDDNDARPSDDWYPHPADPDREDENGNLLSPRADILMFYTTSKGASYIDPRVSSNLHQVVYGHAEMGEYVPDATIAGQYVFESTTGNDPYFPEVAVGGTEYPSPDAPASIQAEWWHLARRDTLLLPTPAAAADIGIDFSQMVGTLGLPSVLRGGIDTVGNFPFEDQVLFPDYAAFGNATWHLPQVLSLAILSQPFDPPYVRSELDPTPPPLYADRLGHYSLPHCASFKVEWSLNPKSEFVAGRLDGVKEILWFDPGDAGNPPDPLRSLAEAYERETDADVKADLDLLLMDKSFDGSIDFDNGFPIEYSLTDRFRGPGFTNANPDSAWEQLAAGRVRPNLVVFTAARLGPRDDSGMYTRVPDAVFPGALRITVDIFDEERRLERPLRHVMVIPIGG